MKSFSRKFVYLLFIIPMMMLSAGCGGGTDFDYSEELELPSPVVAEDSDLIASAKNAKKQKKAKNAEEKGKDSGAENGEVIVISDKVIRSDVDAGGRKSPFVPYRERNLTYESMNFGDLPLPPGEGKMDDALSSLISAKVTGILFEEDSPSAIINVLDSDYLVKPGDKVESFEIETITKDYVAIKTGSNVFRAKVGDIVDGDMYGTGVYNLGHRFAGTYNPASEDDIVIVETKKKDSGSSSKKGAPVGLKDLELPPVPEKGINVKTKINPAEQVDLPPARLDEEN